jgi:hypothetical protein
MKIAAIRQIADYIKDLKEGLYEWDCRGLPGDLKRLYVLIAHFMKAPYETEDQKLKPLLATPEYKARVCE